MIPFCASSKNDFQSAVEPVCEYARHIGVGLASRWTGAREANRAWLLSVLNARPVNSALNAPFCKEVYLTRIERFSPKEVKWLIQTFALSSSFSARFRILG